VSNKGLELLLSFLPNFLQLVHLIDEPLASMEAMEVFVIMMAVCLTPCRLVIAFS
jgi:hypothetical protein